MNNLIIFLSIFATSSTIRVPTWDTVHRDSRSRISDNARQQPNHQKSFQEIDDLLTPTNNGWSPISPAISSKHKHYKKPLDEQIYYKKNVYSKPIQYSSTKIVNVAPLTYKGTKVDNLAYAEPQVNNYFNPFSQVPQQLQVPTFNNNQVFQIPTIPKSETNSPQYIQIVESSLIPHKHQVAQHSFQPQISTFDNNQFFQVSTIFKPKANAPQIIPEVESSLIPQKHQVAQHSFQPQFSTFDNNKFFEVPTISTPKANSPQIIQEVESSLIPQKNSDTFHNFKPLQDLKQVKDAFINRNNYVSHLAKNYRDDKTHEPNQYDPHYITEDTPKVEREQHEKAPVSSHEFPADIPTEPIYPGQGLWAKPGIKHKPFISKQKYDKLEEDEVKPDGYDTFEAGQKVFEKHNKDFMENLKNFPKQHQFSEIEQKQPSENIIEEAEEVNQDSEEDDEFVPMRLYAQVRESENTEYLPENEDDGRLKEAIKEAKIHTVYTEEGYEDSAYDHAGHEKEAANDEGFEDLEREKIEKKENRPAHPKYNLHLPQVSTTKFSVGNGVLTDEEIERLQEDKLNIEDADTAGTEFEEIASAESGSGSSSSSEENFTTNKPIKENKNFISTKETKTMMTKEKDNGNTETEFSGRVDTVLKPNNSTETHIYEKVYPKIYKTIQRFKTIPVTEETPKTVNFSGIFIEEIISSTPTPPTEDLPDEIPITTLPTTAIPKEDGNLEALDSINKGFLKTKLRVKRYSNDFSDLRLNSQFVPVTNHELGKAKEDDTHIKYPYYDKYQDKSINENSPLRYAENLESIPKKTGGNMVFYEEAERKVTCPDIPGTVNAIPERVLKAEQNNEEVDTSKSKKPAEQPKTPRLSGLGDKIDCLKKRYFGENPLDNPIFKEDSIASPVPIFDILKRGKENNSNQFGNKPAPTQNNPKISTNNDINDNNIKTNKLYNQNNATTPNSITVMNLLTTPKYTVALKPKHIYHQIELLDFLPEEAINEEIEKQQPDQLDTNNLNFVSPDLYLDTNSAIRDINNGHGKPFLIFDINKFIPNRSKEETEELVESVKSVNATSRQSRAMPNENEGEEETLPEAEEWRRRKIRRKRPPFQIFDINKFLPTTPFPIFNEKIQNNKDQMKSEVSYKDQIKPNEQFHVLTDILNNIKNSSQEQPGDASIQPSEFVYSNLNPKLYYQDSYLQAYGNQEVDEIHHPSQATTTTTTTIKPVTFRRKTNFRIRKQPSTTLPSRPTVNPAVIKDREEKFKLYLSLLEAKKRQKSSTTTDYGLTIPVTENINDYAEQTTEVMGLMPPSTQRYKTISHPKRDDSLQVSNSGTKKIIKMNKYYVLGMRPPPKQKLILYPEFLNNKNKRVSIRGKRSTSSYASLSRNKEQQEINTEEPIIVDNEEDEAPHRPKSYYYNEKTGKIVYLTTEKPESQEEEEVEYEEIIEQPSSTSKPLQDPVFATATPPPKGKSYVDFVNKLHDESGYKNIPDPTTTEKGQEVTTVPTTTTTLKAEYTTPPPFLDILNKIRQNNEYKVIEDKKEKKVKITTTTEDPEEIVDEEEDSIENIKNSPGEFINEHYAQLGIFDVTGFIPKIKNYLPKTSYDTSKYQTISRPTSKPTTEDETEVTTPVITTTQKPFLIITEEIDSLNEATVIKEAEKTPVQLQRRRLKTTSSSVVTTEQPVTKLPLVNRRRRPTTLRSTRTSTTTAEPSSTEPTLRRNFKRRPIRTQSNNTSSPHSDEDEENITKIVRRRSDSTGTNTPKIRSKNFVETFKTYHRNKKNGGNYRNMEDSNENSSDIKNVTTSGTVEIVADYDETKKHGGNYRREEDAPSENKDENSEEIIDSIPNTSDGDKLIIDLLPKEIEETTTVKINSPKEFTKIEEGMPSTRKPFLRGRTVSNKQKYVKEKRKDIVTEPTTTRLTDIVPKPESFYKDPTLSKSVNMLESDNKPSNEEIISILTSRETDENKEPDKMLRYASSKKPNIVIDPSKRLYYYAPV